MSDEVVFLRQHEICKRLGISDESWRRWVTAGLAPPRVPNIPGIPRWKLSDIQAFERGLGTGRFRSFFASAVRRRA